MLHRSKTVLVISTIIIVYHNELFPLSLAATPSFPPRYTSDSSFITLEIHIFSNPD